MGNQRKTEQTKKANAMRDWLQTRAQAARVRILNARDDAAQTRSPSRTPSRYKVGRTKPVPEPIRAPLGVFRTPAGLLHVDNYETRRKLGQRGKMRRPKRTRDHVGAQARREARAR